MPTKLDGVTPVDLILGTGVFEFNSFSGKYLSAGSANELGSYNPTDGFIPRTWFENLSEGLPADAPVLCYFNGADRAGNDPQGRGIFKMGFNVSRSQIIVINFSSAVWDRELIVRADGSLEPIYGYPFIYTPFSNLTPTIPEMINSGIATKADVDDVKGVADATKVVVDHISIYPKIIPPFPMIFTSGWLSLVLTPPVGFPTDVDVYLYSHPEWTPGSDGIELGVWRNGVFTRNETDWPTDSPAPVGWLTMTPDLDAKPGIPKGTWVITAVNNNFGTEQFNLYWPEIGGDNYPPMSFGLDGTPWDTSRASNHRPPNVMPKKNSVSSVY
jgi:hypothetical protein